LIKDKKPADENGLNSFRQGMSQSEFNSMNQVIKELNQAEVQVFQLNSLRRMIHLEFVTIE
jgi:hypothetical protein